MFVTVSDRRKSAYLRQFIFTDVRSCSPGLLSILCQRTCLPAGSCGLAIKFVCKRSVASLLSVEQPTPPRAPLGLVGPTVPTGGSIARTRQAAVVLGPRLRPTARSIGTLDSPCFGTLALVGFSYAQTRLCRPPSLGNEPLEAGVCLLDVRP